MTSRASSETSARGLPTITAVEDSASATPNALSAGRHGARKVSAAGRPGGGARRLGVGRHVVGEAVAARTDEPDR